MKEIVTDIGRLRISDEVISSVAGAAAAETDGIAGMAPRGMRGGLMDLLGREQASKGVEVGWQGENLIISLTVMVNFGTNIQEMAQEMISRVRSAIERGTGLEVHEVKVFIQGVRMPDGKSGQAG